jgi:hypothetical protein
VAEASPAEQAQGLHWAGGEASGFSDDAEDLGRFELGTEALSGAAASGEDETGETDGIGIGAKWSSSVCNGVIFCGSAFSGANSTSERAAQNLRKSENRRRRRHDGTFSGARNLRLSEDHDETCLVPDSSELCYPIPLAVGRRTARTGEPMAIVAVLVAPTASYVGPRRRWRAAAASSSAASGVDLKALQAAIDKVSAEGQSAAPVF